MAQFKIYFGTDGNGGESWSKDAWPTREEAQAVLDAARADNPGHSYFEMAQVEDMGEVEAARAS